MSINVQEWKISTEGNMNLIHNDDVDIAHFGPFSKSNDAKQDIKYRDQEKANAEFVLKAVKAHNDLVAALEMAHSYMTLKSIDGDVENESLRKYLAYTIRKARGEV